MPPKDTKKSSKPSKSSRSERPSGGGDRAPRRSSPTGSDGSASSSASLGLRGLFDTLPPAPPSDRRIAAAPELDPESLRHIPERTPYLTGDSGAWLYRQGNKLLGGVQKAAGGAASWIGQNDTRLAESVGAGVGSILQGAGVAAQPAAAPAGTPGQGAYGGGVSVTGLLAGYKTIKDVGRLLHNYRHPGEKPKEVNYAEMAANLAASTFVVAYGYYASGAVSDPQTAQMGQAVTAIGAGVAAGAAPWLASREEPRSTTASTPASTPAPSVYPASTAPSVGNFSQYQLPTPSATGSVTSLTNRLGDIRLSDLDPSARSTALPATTQPYGRQGYTQADAQYYSQQTDQSYYSQPATQQPATQSYYGGVPGVAVTQMSDPYAAMGGYPPSTTSAQSGDYSYGQYQNPVQGGAGYYTEQGSGTSSSRRKDKQPEVYQAPGQNQGGGRRRGGGSGGGSAV